MTTQSGRKEEISSKRTPNNNLHLACQEMFHRYCRDFSSETFDHFYRSTFYIFLSFAVEKCSESGQDLDPHEIVNRLYGILVAHASGSRRVPIKALLSWCFGAISNLIKEELRFRSRKAKSLEILENRAEGQTPLDLLIQREDMEKKEAFYGFIRKLVDTPSPWLTERQRKVMRMFYFDGLTLRGIAARLNIRVEHTAVILHRSRKRIALLFKRGYLSNRAAGVLQSLN